MNRIRIGLRSGEFYACLRKEQLTELTKRQRYDTDLARTKGKTVVFKIPHIALLLKKGSDSFVGNTPGFTDLQFDHLLLFGSADRLQAVIADAVFKTTDHTAEVNVMISGF